MAARHASRSGQRRPIHPPLVHAPIGAVVIAVACDLVSALGGASHVWAQTWFKGGTYALSVGTAILVLTAIAGFADRARRTGPGSAGRAAVNRHAAVMLLMGAVCVIDLVLRTGQYDSAQHTPALVLVVTLVALALATVGGELGGRLVYRGGIGVDAKARPRDVRAIAPGEPTERHPTVAVTRPPDRRAIVRRWQAKLVSTMAAWLVAFLLVTALLSFFGHELSSLPLALRALVMSGVLMSVMATIVMPALAVAVGHWLGPTRTGPPARRLHSLQSETSVAEHEPAQGRRP